MHGDDRVQAARAIVREDDALVRVEGRVVEHNGLVGRLRRIGA
jgi:hypothetical protein